MTVEPVLEGSVAPPEHPPHTYHGLQTTGQTHRPEKRYLLRSCHLEACRVDAVQRVGGARVLVACVPQGLLDDGGVLADRLRGAGDGGLGGQAHVVVQRLVQLLVGVGPALRVRVLVVGGVAAVRAVHGVLATWSGQVGQTVVMEIQVIVWGAVRLVR